MPWSSVIGGASGTLARDWSSESAVITALRRRSTMAIAPTKSSNTKNRAKMDPRLLPPSSSASDVTGVSAVIPVHSWPVITLAVARKRAASAKSVDASAIWQATISPPQPPRAVWTFAVSPSKVNNSAVLRTKNSWSAFAKCWGPAPPVYSTGQTFQPRITNPKIAPITKAKMTELLGRFSMISICHLPFAP